MTKRCLLISLLVLAFASSFSRTSAAGNGGSCPPLLLDVKFESKKQLNDSTISNEFGRGVRGRLVTGTSFPNGALFVAATTNVSVEVFLLDPSLSPNSSLISHLSLVIPGAVPSQYYTTLALGNVDGDPNAIPDIAVGSSMTQKVYVFKLGWDGSNLQSSSPELLQSPTPSSTNGFGTSIAIGNLDANAGDEVVVGARGSREVFVFYNDGGPLRFDSNNVQTLTPAITAPLTTADAFGQSVSIADVTGGPAFDILVGAQGSDTTTKRQGNDFGAIFVFDGGANFSQQAVIISDAVTGDEFGKGVAAAVITNPGSFANVIAATGWQNSSSRAVVLPPTPAGETTPVNPELYPLPGLATGWATTGVDAGDLGGVLGDIILVGAPNASSCPSQASAGIVYAYLSNESFGITHAIQSPNGSQKNWLAFGWSAAHIPGTPFFVVGEPGREFNGVRKGQVYLYKYTPPLP